MMSNGEPMASGGNAADSDDRLVSVKLVRAGKRRSVAGGGRVSSRSLYDDEDGGELIGVVVTPLAVKLQTVRTKMDRQLGKLPNKFGFLTANGCPVSEMQESMIELQAIVDSETVLSIRKIFDKEPFVIRTTTGIDIGIIFTDPKTTAEDLRALIHTAGIFPGRLADNDSYRFAFGYNIPITTDQESSLTVWDLSRCGTVSIIPFSATPAAEYVTANAGQSQSPPVNDSAETPVRRRSRSRDQTARSNSGRSSRAVVPAISRAPTNTANKPIFISYVRREARPQAEDIHQALEAINVRAFLDVIDIPTGAHWDSAINRGVQECRLFVALVTDSYGKTGDCWTRKELSLACRLTKRVVPINFVDSYPDSVAIYFSNIQHYVPAVEVGGDGRRANYWEPTYAAPTAREIMRVFNEMLRPRPVPMAPNDEVHYGGHQAWHGDYSLASLTNELQSLEPSDVFEGQGPSDVFEGQGPKPKPRLLVVISAHPTLSGLVEIIKAEFRSRRLAIDVWSSTEIRINRKYLRRSQTLPTGVETPAAGDDHRDARLVQSHSTTAAGDYRCAQLNKAVASPYVTSRFGVQTDDDDDLLRAEKGKAFLMHAEKADVLLVLVSREYVESRTSKQQAYYCGLKDRVMTVMYDTIESPPQWISMLNRSMAREAQDTDEQLALRITEALISMLNGSSTEPAVAIASFVRRNIVDVSERNALFVYLHGRDRDSTPLSEQLCRSIGQALADEPNVVLITDGFSVESEIVGKSFIESRNSSSDLYHAIYNSGESEVVSANHTTGKVVRVNGSARDLEFTVASLFDALVLVTDSPRGDQIAEFFSSREKIVAQVVGDTDTDREVANIVELITRRSRPNTSEA